MTGLEAVGVILVAPTVLLVLLVYIHHLRAERRALLRDLDRLERAQMLHLDPHRPAGGSVSAFSPTNIRL